MAKTNTEVSYEVFSKALQDSGIKNKDTACKIDDEVSGFIPGRGVNVDRSYSLNSLAYIDKGINYTNKNAYESERSEDVKKSVESMLSPCDLFDVGVSYDVGNKAVVSIIMGDEFRDNFWTSVNYLYFYSVKILNNF